MAFYVQNFIYVPALSSPLLLRNYPNTFAFIPVPPISLSSWNRSNSQAFRHIMPCVAPVCEGMHYHKTGVPWQIKSTFIIISPLNNTKPTNRNPHHIFTYFWFLHQLGAAYEPTPSCVLSCVFSSSIIRILCCWSHCSVWTVTILYKKCNLQIQTSFKKCDFVVK